MSKIKLLLFSTFSGLLFALAWPDIGGYLLGIGFAFVPLLWVEDYLSKSTQSKGLAVFFHAYLTFFVFNLLTTWWIYNASDWGAAMAIICNSLFMAIVFWLFHQTKKRVGKKEGYIGLVIYWLAFEYLHLNWELTWVWLTFGNVFAKDVNFVQWYEYTGILGGSFLILVTNLLFFSALKDLLEKSNVHFKYLGAIALLFITSLGISIWVSPEQKENAEEIEFVIVQPNIDPYLDKFSGMSPSDQIDKMVALARSEVTEETDFVILPETAFPEPYWEHDLSYMYGTEEFKKLIAEYPNLRVITGILTSKLYLNKDSLSVTAKKLPGEGWYDNYNAAMYLDSSSKIELHRKSKLVLGVEKVPFLKTFPIMKKLSISLGGSSGRYGTQESPSVFSDEDQKVVVAPIICYESIYGEYVNQYAQKGANVYAIITNDGWWGDTPGYKQHLAYARLRAIESRRAIVRSANTGISAIIDAKGNIIQQSNWWEEAVLKGSVLTNNKLTFYVKHGDYIGRTAAFIAPLLLLLTLVKSLNKTEQRLKLKKG